MKAFAALLALAMLASVAAAQSLVVVTGNGAVVPPGAAAPRVVISARDANGIPRAGVTVSFDSQCTYRTRGEIGPYACVTTADPLDVVSDIAGNVQSPQYLAELVTGNAWLVATAVIDGRLVQMPFYYTVGNAPVSPVRIVSGDNQVVQLGFAAEPLIARIVDDFGRGVAGIRVRFDSSCSPSTLPCLLPAAGPTRDVSDSQGFVDSGVRLANNVTGSYAVLLVLPGGAVGPASFSLTNIPPTRSAVTKTRTGAEAFLRITDAPATCAITRLQPLNDTLAPPAPFMLAVPQGLIELWIDNCPAGAKVSFQLQHPGGFPEGSRIWSVRPAWQPRESVNPIEGFWEFALTDGAAGDADAMANGSIRTVFAVGYGDPAAPNYQDLWWVGYDENGWGISVTQHGDVLFVIVFAYDAQGQPTWYVMPGGSWNATRDTYTGMLYSPRGRPLGEHVAANLAVGAPVGSLAFTFYDTMTGRAVFNFGAAETIKLVKRQFFGVRDARVTGRYADLWWGGASRSGWGFVLQQQYASMFALLFTYGADGKPIWYTMPSITRNTNETFFGPVYRTASSAWPAGYDPNLLVSPDVGEFQVQFNNGTATFDFIAEGRTSRFTISRQPF